MGTSRNRASLDSGTTMLIATSRAVRSLMAVAQGSVVSYQEPVVDAHGPAFDLEGPVRSRERRNVVRRFGGNRGMGEQVDQ